MKQYLKWVVMFSILMLAFVFIPSLVHAQTDPYCDPFGMDQNGKPCPIDGGLSVLLAVGVGYGIKKYKDVKKSISSDKHDSD